MKYPVMTPEATSNGLVYLHQPHQRSRCFASLSVESVMHSDFVKAPLVGLTPTSTLEVGVGAH